MQGEPLLALGFGIAKVLDHSLWFLRMLTNVLLDSMAARAPRRRPRPTHEGADDGPTSVPCTVKPLYIGHGPDKISVPPKVAKLQWCKFICYINIS